MLTGEELEFIQRIERELFTCVQEVLREEVLQKEILSSKKPLALKATTICQK
jgi:hypothetical protein